MTGQTGEQGGYKKSPYMEMPQKWKELFCGHENEKLRDGLPDSPRSR